MARALSTNMLDAFSAEHAIPVAFARFDFDSGKTRITTAAFAIDWDDGSGDGVQTWLGAGAMASVSTVRENEALEATSVSFALSGISPAVVSAALQLFPQGRPASLWVGAISPATGALVASPVLRYRGRIDTMSIKE